MGNRGSSHSKHMTKRQISMGRLNFPSAKVVHPDGHLEEFHRQTTADEVLSNHPNCFLCSSDTLLVDSHAPQLPPDHVLQFGQLYFLLPLSKSLFPLSLQDLCALAIKASTAIGIGTSGTHLNDKRKAGRGGDYRDIAVTF